MLRFSTTFLLVSGCLLVNADVPTKMVTTCEGDHVQHLRCDSGVISVQAMMYGRTDRATCSEGKSVQQTSNTNCSLTDVNVIKSRCDGKKLCEVRTNVFQDPCSDTFKYLQTKYTCLPAIHEVTCEHSLAHLQCDEGQVIFIYGADYGRRDRTTCSYKRSAFETINTACSRPTSIVSERCNGKNSCVIKASNSVFGDPCSSTYKYLEVAYTCDYALTTPAMSA